MLHVACMSYSTSLLSEAATACHAGHRLTNVLHWYCSLLLSIPLYNLITAKILFVLLLL